MYDWTPKQNHSLSAKLQNNMNDEQMQLINQSEIVGIQEIEQSAEEETGLLLPILNNKPKVIKNRNCSNASAPLLLR